MNFHLKERIWNICKKDMTHIFTFMKIFKSLIWPCVSDFITFIKKKKHVNWTWMLPSDTDISLQTRSQQMTNLTKETQYNSPWLYIVLQTKDQTNPTCTSSEIFYNNLTGQRYNHLCIGKQAVNIWQTLREKTRYLHAHVPR